MEELESKAAAPANVAEPKSKKRRITAKAGPVAVPQDILNASQSDDGTSCTEENKELQDSSLLTLVQGKMVCTICLKKAGPNGERWAKTTKHARQQPVPFGPVCKACGDFVDVSPYDLKKCVLNAKAAKCGRKNSLPPVRSSGTIKI